MDCTAPPAVPLVRLSIAATATSRRASGSTVTCRWTVFAPSVAAVLGHVPSGSRWTNGSSAYAFAYASTTSAADGVRAAPCRWPGCRAAAGRGPG